MPTMLLGTVMSAKTGADARFIEFIIDAFSMDAMSIVHKVLSNG